MIHETHPVECDFFNVVDSFDVDCTFEVIVEFVGRSEIQGARVTHLEEPIETKVTSQARVPSYGSSSKFTHVRIWHPVPSSIVLSDGEGRFEGQGGCTMSEGVRWPGSVRTTVCVSEGRHCEQQTATMVSGGGREWLLAPWDRVGQTDPPRKKRSHVARLDSDCLARDPADMFRPISHADCNAPRLRGTGNGLSGSATTLRSVTGWRRTRAMG